MTVYLRKQLIHDTSDKKVEVFSFCISPFSGGKEIKTDKEPEWWRNFNTEQEALNHLL